jgi:hypothetical protein
VTADQPAFAPENLTTFAHFSVSLTMNLRKSGDEMGNAIPPRSANPRLDLGIGETPRTFRVELVDDLGGRIPGRTNTV